MVQPLPVVVRPARPGDVPHIVSMIRELAEYERAVTEARATDELLHKALFDTDAAAYCHVAEQRTRVVGFALWFLSFSTWLGRHGIYLEDLYVRPTARGAGVGTALLRELAQICADRGYPRLDWQVLDWNLDAQAFYRRVGAVPMDDWTVWRLTGVALRDLADE